MLASRARPSVRPIARWAPIAGIAAIVLLVPLLFAGPGTDLDVGAVIQSGRAILHGNYEPSRAPGAPVHEAAVGVLERVGGTALANAGSLAMAVLLVAALVVLLRRERVPRPALATAVVVANPWFLIAATSVVDFAWATGLCLWGVVAMRAGRRVVAGVLFGLAIGCRMSTALLVVAALVAEVGAAGLRSIEWRGVGWRGVGWRGGGWREQLRPVVLIGVIAAVVGALTYLPAYLHAGRSLAFAQNDFRTASPAVHLGRFVAKDIYFLGPFAFIALLVLLPAIVRGLRGVHVWRTSFVFRFAFVGLIAQQALFLRFPWKMGHLIPSLVCLALLLAVALAKQPRLLVALVALQLLFAVVNVELFEPNKPNGATGATFEVNPRWGPLVVDTQCRLEDEDAWVGNNQARLEAVWTCAKPWGDGP
jgi:hypothetical protein